MIKLVPLIPLLWAALAGHEKIVDIKIDGLDSKEAYVAVEKACRAVPGVRRVDFFLSSGETQTHLVVSEGRTVELESVEKAVAAARSDLKETTKKDSTLTLDESDIRLPEGAAYLDGEGVARKVDHPISLEAFRREVKAFSRLVLPLDDHVSGAFACPSHCSGSNRAGHCPLCGQAFRKVEGDQPPAG